MILLLQMHMYSFSYIMQITTLKHVFQVHLSAKSENMSFPQTKEYSDSNRGWMNMHVEDHLVLIQPPQRDWAQIHAMGKCQASIPMMYFQIWNRFQKWLHFQIVLPLHQTCLYFQSCTLCRVFHSAPHLQLQQAMKRRGVKQGKSKIRNYTVQKRRWCQRAVLRPPRR